MWSARPTTARGTSAEAECPSCVEGSGGHEVRTPGRGLVQYPVQAASRFHDRGGGRGTARHDRRGFERQYRYGVAQKDKKTYDFPSDLIEAQAEIFAVRSELHDLLQRQPWSAEPLPAWTTHENAWRPASRPDSPGWDPADRERIERLRVREAELVTLLVGHRFWTEVAPDELTEARSQLKHHQEPAAEVAEV